MITHSATVTPRVRRACRLNACGHMVRRRSAASSPRGRRSADGCRCGIESTGRKDFAGTSLEQFLLHATSARDRSRSWLPTAPGRSAPPRIRSDLVSARRRPRRQPYGDTAGLAARAMPDYRSRLRSPRRYSSARSRSNRVQQGHVRRSAGRVSGRSSVQETGLRNARPRRRQIRLQGSGRGSLELRRRLRSTSTRSQDSEGHHRRGRRVLRRDRRPHRPLARRTSSSSATRPPRTSIWWERNGKLTPAQFDLLLNDFIAHARGKELFAQDLYGGADPKYRIKARVFTELAWHSLFIRSLLIRPERSELDALRSRFHHPLPAVVQGRSQAPRRAQRDGHRHRLHQAHDPDRRQRTTPAR